VRRAALVLLVVAVAAGIAIGALRPEAGRAQSVTCNPSPNFGPVGGGTLVTINGAGFTAPASVTFGGVSATSITVVNASQITAVTPASPIPSPGIGTVPVSVVAGAGNCSGQFTYSTSGGGGTSAFSGQVFVVAPGGNDANTCVQPASGATTPSTFACATIQGAVNKTRDHDTVDVLPGVYDLAAAVEVPDLIAIFGSASVTSVPSLPGVSTGGVGSCSGSSVKVILRSTSGQPIFHVTATGSPIAFPVVTGFILGGSTSLVNPGAIQVDGASYAQIACNTIGQEDLPNGIGVLLKDADNVEILSNTIHGSTQFPISAALGPTPPVGGFGVVTSECLGSGHSDDAVIAGNLLALNSNAGVYLCSDGTGGHRVQSNTVRGNGRGIVLQDVNDSVVTSNAVQDNYYNGIEVLDSSQGNWINGNTIESQDGPNGTGIVLMGGGELFPLDNVVTGNFLRRNGTNIYIAGARRTLIGVDKSLGNPAAGGGPAGHIVIGGTANSLTAQGERTNVVLALGNAAGGAFNGANPAFGQPTDTIISGNTILANGPCVANSGCAIRLTAGVTVNIDATRNEWGVTSNDQIRSVIWDKYRDPALGQVLIYASTALPPATATPQPFAAPSLPVGAVSPFVAPNSVAPPNFPAPTTAAPGAAPPAPAAYINPATGNYYAELTVCVTGTNNQPVANDQLALTLSDQHGGELGVVLVTTAANGCFSGDVSATGGAAQVPIGSVSLTDASGAVTNLPVQTGSSTYRPPSGPVSSSGPGG